MPTLTFAGPPGAIDELGVWTPALDAGGFEALTPREFSLAEGAGRSDTLLWQQDFAASGATASGLTVAQARLTVAAAALPQAQARATVFAAAGGQVIGVGAELAGPEADLAEWARLAPQPDALSRRPDFRAAAEGVAAFFEKVRAALRSYATIVTRVDGAAVALTEVAWTGGFRAAWAAGLPVTDAAQHNAAVTLALRTRDLWLRLAATVIGGAAQLAALFAANPLLALPAAYRFARQVIEQAQMLNLPSRGL